MTAISWPGKWPFRDPIDSVLRMGRTQRVGLAVLTTAVLVAGAAAAPRANAASTVRYAAPAGSGTACTSTSPCSIDEALSSPPTSTQVVMLPGAYGSPSAPLTEELIVGGGIVTIGGTAGGAAVLIYSSAAAGAVSVDAGVLHDVTVLASGPTAIGTGPAGIATRVSALDTAAAGTACDVGSSMTDSVCLATGAAGVAVLTNSSADTDAGTVTTATRNVTAEATGPNGTGLLDSAGTIGDGALNLVVDAENDIIHGTSTDVEAVTTSENAIAEVILRNSDFDPSRSGGIGLGDSSLDTDGSDIATPAAFVNSAAANFHEAAGSPTIDNGASRPAGDLDRAGNPRDLGGGPDIGAFEFVPKPTLHGIRISSRTRHSLSGSVSGNGFGIATHIKIVVTRHGRVIGELKSPTTPARGFDITFHLHGLAPHRTYHLYAVAQNRAGTTRSPSRQATTRR